MPQNDSNNEECDRLLDKSAASKSSATFTSSANRPSKFKLALLNLSNNIKNSEQLSYALTLFEEAASFSMKLVGPGLIMLATGLITGVMYWGIKFIVPMYGAPWSISWCFHSFMACFLGGNMLFNYAMCVCTDAGSTNSAFYRKLVSQARATGALPTDPSDDVAFLDPEYYAEHGNAKRSSLGGKKSEQFVVDLDSRSNHAVQNSLEGSSHASLSVSPDAEMRKRNADVGSSLSKSSPRKQDARKTKGGWMERGPYEWMYCHRTSYPKAPRAHYDHVTKQQVLNMDHYCPWMFNPVGYLNYRYFWLFLMWTWLGCLYCILMTVIPFSAINRRRPIWGITVPHQSRSSVSFIFIITTSVGCAVTLLFFWHVYLLFTAQTTIEFYGNRTRARKMRMRGEIFKNPYDLGRWRNWCQVMGTGNPVLAVLPSTRTPPGSIPWPSFRQNAVDRPRFPKSTV